MRTWQLQQAKAHLSEVVQETIVHGPQKITLRGKPAVIMISIYEYQRLTKPKPSFVKFMRKSPLMGLKINIARDKSLTRDDIDL